MSGFDFYKKLKWLFDHLINIKSRKQVHLDFKKIKKNSVLGHTYLDHFRGRRAVGEEDVEQ